MSDDLIPMVYGANKNCIKSICSPDKDQCLDCFDENFKTNWRKSVRKTPSYNINNQLMKPIKGKMKCHCGGGYTNKEPCKFIKQSMAAMAGGYKCFLDPDGGNV